MVTRFTRERIYRFFEANVHYFPSLFMDKLLFHAGHA